MKIKQKLIDAKKSVVDFGKEHPKAIINATAAPAAANIVAYIGYGILGMKQEMAIDVARGFTEIGDKVYKLSEDGDFITVEQWNEHIK
jgi:hypothetical protein